MIISDSRTGSTLLMQRLNINPEILAFGEEFKNLNDKSCHRIWDKIYRKRPKEVKWVGFKLFYFHHRKSKDRKVWDFIQSHKGITIIHLTRRNILRSYVSKQIGLKTRPWTENIASINKLNNNEKKVELDPDACREPFENISDYIEQTERRFENYKIIPVVYEELDKNKQASMNKLEVEPIEVSTYMKKQNPEKSEDLFINFLELKKEFSGTKWEHLFKLEDLGFNERQI